MNFWLRAMIGHMKTNFFLQYFPPHKEILGNKRLATSRQRFYKLWSDFSGELWQTQKVQMKASEFMLVKFWPSAVCALCSKTDKSCKLFCCLELTSNWVFPEIQSSQALREKTQILNLADKNCQPRDKLYLCVFEASKIVCVCGY